MANSAEGDRAERIAALVRAARVERAQTVLRMLHGLLRGTHRDRADVAWPAQARPAVGDCR